jgi:hypothetical protein
MAGAWAFRTRTWGRPGYTAVEGTAECDGEAAEFFLVVGAQHVSLDIQSLRGFADRLLDLCVTILGQPETGPAVVNIGELMDSLDEVPLNATWTFPPGRRQELLSALARLLGAGCAGASLSAGEPRR